MSASIEMLDIYDGTGKHRGVKSRAEVHRDGDWHRTVHCWIIYQDEAGEAFVVLQRRSDNKASWPGYVDITAAGHFVAGETLEQALREIQEEIGVAVVSSTLVSLGIRVCVEDFKPGVLNHEFQHVFFLIDNRPLDGYSLQAEELSGILQARVDDLLELFRGEVESVTVEGLQVQKDDGQLIRRPATFSISRDQFIPSIDNYNYKIMVLAKRALSGEKDLLI
jgi:isopentenyldiphosphate isomerase